MRLHNKIQPLLHSLRRLNFEQEKLLSRTDWKPQCVWMGKLELGTLDIVKMWGHSKKVKQTGLELLFCLSLFALLPDIWKRLGTKCNFRVLAPWGKTRWTIPCNYVKCYCVHFNFYSLINNAIVNRERQRVKLSSLHTGLFIAWWLWVLIAWLLLWQRSPSLSFQSSLICQLPHDCCGQHWTCFLLPMLSSLESVFENYTFL